MRGKRIYISIHSRIHTWPSSSCSLSLPFSQVWMQLVIYFTIVTHAFLHPTICSCICSTMNPRVAVVCQALCLALAHIENWLQGAHALRKTDNQVSQKRVQCRRWADTEWPLLLVSRQPLKAGWTSCMQLLMPEM